MPRVSTVWLSWVLAFDEEDIVPVEESKIDSLLEGEDEDVSQMEEVILVWLGCLS